MAAITLRAGAELNARRWPERFTVTARLYLRLCSQRAAGRTTTTFKSRKVELRNQAYGADIEDPLYVLAGPDEGYVPYYEYPEEVSLERRPQG